MQLELSPLKRWNSATKFDYYFATQYKECFVYFGIPHDTSVAYDEANNEVCTMRGCVATPEVDKENGYIWFPMPQLSIQLQRKHNVTGSVKVCGGYTSGERIKVVGVVDIPGRNVYQRSYITKCWDVSLTMPSLHWSETTPTIVLPPNDSLKPRNEQLVAIQKCKQYLIYFYVSQPSDKSKSTLIVTDEEKQQSCSFLTGSVTFDRYVNCVVIGADMFIVSGDKMAKVEKFSHYLLVASTKQATESSITFDLSVPHANSTLFVIQDTLCVVGGCDEDCEPFSNIYQFDQSTQVWNECGFSTVSRFGASVVVFTDRNKKECIFIAGGFKGKNMPCSIIEVLSVNFKFVE